MDYRSLTRLRGWMLLALVLSAMLGCTRARYRCAADKDVATLMGYGDWDPRWKMKDFSIDVSPGSRMYDPTNPDRPPMPPDDPSSHKLMLRVDGMNGWPHWDRNGFTTLRDNPNFVNCLPRDANGVVVLDRAAAMQVALMNSPTYQSVLESLYLGALNVTFQRFRFDVQFYGSNSTFFTAVGPDGGGSSSTLAEDNALEFRKLSATGGELVAGVANSLVWQFAGPDQYSATSLLNFSFLQPLLRAGGRAVVLESLTEAERALLGNIRQMEHYRCGFYGQTIAGSSPGAAPSSGSLGIGALSSSTAGTGGLLALLESQVRIRNQRGNVAGLRSSLDQLVALHEAGRIDSLQVDQARQALYSGQSSLLAQESGYQDALDGYKMSLGLPPSLEMRVDDPLLKGFELLDPETTAARDAISNLLAKLRDPEVEITPADYTEALEEIPRQCQAVIELVGRDMEGLNAKLPARRDFLRLLSSRKELTDGDVDPSVASIEELDRRVKLIHENFLAGQEQLTSTLEEIEKAKAILKSGSAQSAAEKVKIPGEDAALESKLDPQRTYLLELMTRLGNQFSEFSLAQASCRLEGITLVPVELGSAEAFEIAQRNRLDWMNARAAMVDNWRQIEVVANSLEGDLSVLFSGNMGTVGNNPIQFRGTTGQLRVGLQFDPPLTRLAERNAYRQALISYQQSRRAYYAAEDSVSQTLRTTLRSMERSQLNFEVLRAGLRVAISQVDFTQFRLQAPPPPGGAGGLAPTARDLVTALTSLLNSQDELLFAWVNYEVQRMNLDFNLGTMKLDSQNMWIDPGPIKPDHSAKNPEASADAPVAPMPEEIPAPAPLPADAT